MSLFGMRTKVRGMASKGSAQCVTATKIAKLSKLHLCVCVYIYNYNTMAALYTHSHTLIHSRTHT